MKKLYVKTKSGTVLIDQAIVEKYHLKTGTMSPFSQSSIVDENGNSPRENDPPDRGLDAESKGELINDGIAQLDNGLTLSQSEIIDISQGVDSSNG
jgi:hypothetical protein